MEKNFKKISNKIRWGFLDLISKGFKYHLGGTSSCIDLMVVLFYGNFIKLENKIRDKYILSKGHALGALHAILLNKNLITMNRLLKLKKSGKIGGQLDIFTLKKYVDWNTGSLGHAAGIATGMAIAEPKKKIWVILGDAEIDEGSVWEALFFISEKKIKNIIILIDRNKISASSRIEKKEVLDKKILNNLNLNITKINGHNHKEILKSYNFAVKSNRSTIIIANTIKGKGFGIAENNLDFSHQAPNKELINNLKKIYE